MRRLRLLAAALCAFAVLPAQAAPPERCVPLAVSVAQTDPMRATLTWTPSPGAIAYFVQYSTGKFPTQHGWTRAAGATEQVELHDLTPGQSYTVELCEAYEPGACPGGPDADACTTLVELTAATAWPGTAQPDPARAVCAMTADVAIIGETPRHPYDEPLPAGSADECCRLCATAEAWRPYTAQCTHFTFDPTARLCFLKRHRLGDTPAPGAVSGEVRAWPARP